MQNNHSFTVSSVSNHTKQTNSIDSMNIPSSLGVQFNTNKPYLNQAIELVSSMRFAIAVLVLVASASIIGTVVEQNKPWVNYVNQFGIFWAELFQSLSLFSVYNSAWFLLIMAFLVLSLTLCIVKNMPLIKNEIRSFKHHIGRAGILAHPYRGHSIQSANILDTHTAVINHLQQTGYHFKSQLCSPDSTKCTEYMIAAKKGMANRLGYLFAHSGMVIILLGGLLDSELPLNLLAFSRQAIPVKDNRFISQVPPISRLPLTNFSYRANVLVPEGASTRHAVINYQDGVLVQPLPFELTLKQFNVAYYSTGMPKSFISQVQIRDIDTGKTFEKTIKVNEPLHYKGVTVYQSSFDDGGSNLSIKAYPLNGQKNDSFALKGTVGNRISLKSHANLDIELSAYRPINVEDFSNVNVKQSTTLSDNLNTVLGVPSPRQKHLRNIGPSVMYKLRDQAGQAKEYHAYQLPVQLNDEGQMDTSAQSVFLLGMRNTPNESFKFVRFPADEKNSLSEYMRLSTALSNPILQQRGVSTFVLKNSIKESSNTAIKQQLQMSAAKALNLFAGNRTKDMGGFTAIAKFIDTNVPKAQTEAVAAIILRILSSVVWEVWQQSRVEDGLPVLDLTPANQLFLQTALTAYSDSFLLNAPFILQLESAQFKQASVFQITKSPGKYTVYIGSLLLIIGIFAMFYIRQSRLWVWLTVIDQNHTDIVWALSSPKQGLAFKHEYQYWQPILGNKNKAITIYNDKSNHKINDKNNKQS